MDDLIPSMEIQLTKHILRTYVNEPNTGKSLATPVPAYNRSVEKWSAVKCVQGKTSLVPYNFVLYQT